MKQSSIAQVVLSINNAASRRNSEVNDQSIYWVDYSQDRYVRLIGAHAAYVDPSAGDDIAEPVAFLDGGGHIALENCELCDFRSMTPAFGTDQGIKVLDDFAITAHLGDGTTLVEEVDSEARHDITVTARHCGKVEQGPWVPQSYWQHQAFDRETVAQAAYVEYDFGAGVVVEDDSGFEHQSDGDEWVRSVFVNADDQDPEQPTIKLTFIVRFLHASDKLLEVFARDNKGCIWGVMPGGLPKRELGDIAPGESF